MITHQNRLVETILMSTNSIAFGRDLKDLECHHSLLFGWVGPVVRCMTHNLEVPGSNCTGSSVFFVGVSLGQDT